MGTRFACTYLTLFYIAIQSAACQGCQKNNANQPVYFYVPRFGLKIPAHPDWQKEDISEEAKQAEDKSVLLLKLVPKQNITGGPRIRVIAIELQPQESLESLVADHLDAMEQLVHNGQINIETSKHKALTISGLPAIMLTHRYHINQTDNEIAISQISMMILWRHTSIQFVAAGRTELFTPMEKSIEAIFMGVQLPPHEEKLPDNKTPGTPPALENLGPLGYRGWFRALIPNFVS